MLLLSLKKLAAILLLSLMLFNMVGFKWAFNYVEGKSAQRLDAAIDAGEYDESMLVEVQVPLNLPYYSDSDYEPFYGEMELNVQHFRYVKRKVSNNILYLLCLPHTEKNDIVAVKKDFVKATNDHTQDPAGKSSLPGVIKLLLCEFESNDRLILPALAMDVHSRERTSDFIFHSQFEPSLVAPPPKQHTV